MAQERDGKVLTTSKIKLKGCPRFARRHKFLLRISEDFNNIIIIFLATKNTVAVSVFTIHHASAGVRRRPFARCENRFPFLVDRTWKSALSAS